MKLKFTIGCDPEIFCQDESSVRSVIGKIGGTKADPMPLPLGDGFAVQEDNVALEFNVPAASNRDSFISNVRSAMEFLESVVKDKYGYKFVNQAAISFPDSELQDPASWVFGCDPDYNAWTGRRNPRPKTADKNLRSAGGHVHVGIDGLDQTKKFNLIRFMDLYLAVPSIFMDKDEQRRKLYGKLGACRIKPYGVEYRVLSNFWVFNPRLIQWVYDNTERALDATMKQTPFDDIADIVQAVNLADKAAGERLIKKYNLEVVQ